MYKLIKYFLFLCAILSINNSTFSKENTEKVLLRYNCNSYNSLQYKVEDYIQNSIRIDEENFKTAVEVLTNFDFVVKKDETENDSTCDLLLEMGDMEVVSRYGDQTRIPGSSSVEGKNIKVTIDSDIDISEIKDLDIFPKIGVGWGARKVTSGEVDERALYYVSNPYGENYGELLPAIFFKLPVKSVSKEDEWGIVKRDSSCLDMLRTTMRSGKYKIKKFTNKKKMRCVEIKGEFDLKISHQDTTSGHELKYVADGKEDIDIIFAIEKGVILEKKSSIQIKGFVEMFDPVRLLQRGPIVQYRRTVYKLVD